MIDIHTHILPQIDDGSQSVEESLQLLRQEAAQGVTQVALTPHFYALEDSPRRFLERRQRAYEALLPHLEPGLPQLRLGAEVQYFEGICSAEQIGELRIQGTRLLLLEMPFCPWTERMREDVLALNARPDIQVVLAHVERYLRWQDRDTLPELLDSRVLTQVNAGAFTHWKTRGRALQLLRKGQVAFLGSDCHDLTARPPRLREAGEQIAQKLGRASLDRLTGYSYAVIANNRI